MAIPAAFESGCDTAAEFLCRSRAVALDKRAQSLGRIKSYIIAQSIKKFREDTLIDVECSIS
jgi:hypothetical protein